MSHSGSSGRQPKAARRVARGEGDDDADDAGVRDDEVKMIAHRVVAWSDFRRAAEHLNSSPYSRISFS